MMNRLIDEAGPDDGVYEFREDAFESAQKTLVGEWRRFSGLLRQKFPTMFITVPHKKYTMMLAERFTDEWPEQPAVGIMWDGGIEQHFAAFCINEEGDVLAARESRFENSSNYQPDKEHRQLVNEAAMLLAYLNMPKLGDRQFVSSDRLNKKRIACGFPPLPHKTVIRASSAEREYLDHLRHPKQGIMPEHWVGGHRHLYWCGQPPNQELKPRWIAPYKRGDAKNGTRPPRYDVRP